MTITQQQLETFVADFSEKADIPKELVGPLTTVAVGAYGQGRAAERGAIVAHCRKFGLLGGLAADLERGVHLLVLCLALFGCAADHEPPPRGDGPPLYVHLCDAMPAADQLAWGDAAGAINAERFLALEVPVLWVGHGEPDGCDTIDVCPSSALLAGAETSFDPCTTTVRYAPGAAQQVASVVLQLSLDQWGPHVAAAWHVDIGAAVLRGGS
jgi:hypothetical protein